MFRLLKWATKLTSEASCSGVRPEQMKPKYLQLFPTTNLSWKIVLLCGCVREVQSPARPRG